MNTIYKKKVKAFKNQEIHVERFDSAEEVVRISAGRTRTSTEFKDMHNPSEVDESWVGVKTYEEAAEMMITGYQPTVDEFKKGIKANVSGQEKRISFFNDVVGFQPIIPLALMNVPTSMQNTYMKPIKAKVVNVYYDMTANCGVTKEELIKAGQKILAAILELEMQGYKFNLYATQTYYNSGYDHAADMICVKVKNANTPLDLERISFPLTHPAFFRVIGFDWYSKFPIGKYRIGYGRAIGYEYSQEKLNEGFEEIFNEKCVVFAAAKMLDESTDHIKEVLTNDK